MPTYYSTHKPVILERQRAKRQTAEAKAKTREYSRRYYQKHRERIIAKIQANKKRPTSFFNITYGIYTVRFD